MLPWVVFLTFISAWAYIMDGIMVGATRAKEMRNSMVYSTFLGFLPFWLLFKPFLGLSSLWLGLIALNLIRGITLSKVTINQLLPKSNSSF